MTYFGPRETIVLWDIEDCPLPPGLVANKVARNIRMALRSHGYHNPVSFTVFGDFEHLLNDFTGFSIYPIEPKERQKRQRAMLLKLLNSSLGRGATNFMLITGEISPDVNLLCAIDALKSTGYFKFFFAQPVITSWAIADDVNTVWLWNDLAAGVIWDAAECGTGGVSVVEVSKRIRSALASMNYNGTTSIFAYGDLDQIQVGLESPSVVVQLKPADATRILRGLNSRGFTFIYADESESKPSVVAKHIPKPKEGNQLARIDEILVEIYSWALRNPGPANLVLILGDFSGYLEFVTAFHGLLNNSYNIILVQPENASAPPHIPDRIPSLLWERLLVGEVFRVERPIPPEDLVVFVGRSKKPIKWILYGGALILLLSFSFAYPRRLPKLFSK